MITKTPASKRKKMRLYTIVGIFILLGMTMFLVLRAFEKNIRFFVTPSELESGEFTGNEQFRLGGLVEMGSVHSKEGILKIMFSVTDGGTSIPVIYEGILPDLFREGQGVVVEGTLQGDGVFLAVNVLAKHDENYMPPEVAEALKEQGLWQESEKEE